MKKTITLLLPLLLTILMFACKQIDIVDIRSDYSVGDNVTIPLSVIVTQNEANEIADMFMRSNAGSDMTQTKSADTKRVSSSSSIREDGQDLMYIFNYDDGGFVIVGATRDYYPILAYSDKGSFVLREDMGPVDVWLDETKVCIKNSCSLDETTKAQMQNLWARRHLR